MKSVNDKIRDGEYKPKMEYPTKPQKPRLASGADSAQVRAYADQLDRYQPDMEAYRAKVREFNAEETLMENQLRRDLEIENGVPHDHPKANLLWSKAWDVGHSEGYGAVASEYADLAELVV